MKYCTLLFVLFALSVSVTAQNGGPGKLTAETKRKIKKEVDVEGVNYKKELLADTTQDLNLSPDELEFLTDKFKILQIAKKSIEIDNSTSGMADITVEATVAFDKLMNRYYNKLLKGLKPEDRKVLIAAQKAWLIYRDAEEKLIWIMTKDEYSGGGSLQILEGVSKYSDLVLERTNIIFNYYNNNWNK